jgi:hypothetical protein
MFQGIFTGELWVRCTLFLWLAWMMSYVDMVKMATVAVVFWVGVHFIQGQTLMYVKRTKTRRMKPPSKLGHVTFQEKTGEDESEELSGESLTPPCTPPSSPRSLPPTPMKPKHMESPSPSKQNPEWDEDLRILVEMASRRGVPE